MNWGRCVIWFDIYHLQVFHNFHGINGIEFMGLFYFRKVSLRLVILVTERYQPQSFENYYHPLNGCARGSSPVLFIIRPLLFPIIISIAVCGCDEKNSSHSPPQITIKIVRSISKPNVRFIHWNIKKAVQFYRNYKLDFLNCYRFSFRAHCQC